MSAFVIVLLCIAGACVAGFALGVIEEWLENKDSRK